MPVFTLVLKTMLMVIMMIYRFDCGALSHTHTHARARACARARTHARTHACTHKKLADPETRTEHAGYQEFDHRTFHNDYDHVDDDDLRR